MKTSKRFTAIAITSAILTLTACGGGGDSSPQTETATAPITTTPVATKSYSGKVIDGYVEGATIWLDINGNGKLEENYEPNAISTSEGDYMLELDTDEYECLHYAPIIVDVPVGAYDQDLGVVQEAYRMVLPPRIGNYFAEDNANVTPLTTVLWEMIQSDYVLKDESLTSTTRACAALKAQRETLDDLGRQIKEVITLMVDTYNISEDEVFSDFIAAGNSGTANKAIEIVKGLKKGFEKSKEMRERNPHASVARVTYMKDKLHGWVADEYIFEDGSANVSDATWTPHSKASQVKRRVSGDTLDNLGSVISKYSRDILGRKYGNKTVFIGTGGDECSSMDYYESADDGTEYEIANNNSSCADVPNTKSVFSTRWSNRAERLGKGAQYLIEEDETIGDYPVLAHLKNFKTSRNQIDPDTINSEINSFLPVEKGSLDTAWLDENFRTVRYWSFSQSGSNRIELTETLVGGEFQGERKTIASDGTWTLECRPTENDAWGACS